MSLTSETRTQDPCPLTRPDTLSFPPESWPQSDALGTDSPLGPSHRTCDTSLLSESNCQLRGHVADATESSRNSDLEAKAENVVHSKPYEDSPVPAREASDENTEAPGREQAHTCGSQANQPGSSRAQSNTTREEPAPSNPPPAVRNSASSVSQRSRSSWETHAMESRGEPSKKRSRRNGSQVTPGRSSSRKDNERQGSLHGSVATSELSGEESCLQRHNVKIRGSGIHLLVLAHGFGTNQTAWDGVLKHLDLQMQFRVILWDLMGAFSTNPEKYDAKRYLSLHAHADDLLEILEELQVERVTYVGHSMSGMVGILASIECPSKFDRLILVGASPRYLNDHASGYHGGFELGDLDQLCSAIQSNYTTWVSGYSAVAVGASIDDPAVREFGRTLFLLRPDIALMTLKMVFQSDFRSILPKVERPVHLLRTEHDHAVPTQVAEYMKEHLPDARCDVLPLAGHLPHLTHPKVVAQAISRHALLRVPGAEDADQTTKCQS